MRHANLRAALSIVPLWSGAFAGLIGAANLDTCTGGAADALALGFFVAVLNLIGVALLAPGVSRWALGLAISIPALSAIYYTLFAVRFAGGVVSGQSACAILTGEPTYAFDGSEMAYAVTWVASAAIFWVGTMLAIRNSLSQKECHDDERRDD